MKIIEPKLEFFKNLLARQNYITDTVFAKRYIHGRVLKGCRISSTFWSSTLQQGYNDIAVLRWRLYSGVCDFEECEPVSLFLSMN